MRKFEVVSGKMVLSDPCYELGTWCQGVIDNVKNGTWVGGVEQSEEGVWGLRNSMLISMNVEALEKNPNLENELMSRKHLLDFDGGVDSGQFGHFDFDNYRKDDNIIDEPKAFDDNFEKRIGDKWYSACCYQTLKTEDDFGAVPFGVVSSSGYGDGSYLTYGVKDENNQWVGFMTIFIDNEENGFEEQFDDFEEIN